MAESGTVFYQDGDLHIGNGMGRSGVFLEEISVCTGVDTIDAVSRKGFKNGKVSRPPIQ